MGKILSLREYIDDYENQEEFKVSTFCRLMQIVSDAIEQVDRNLIRINLDDIKVDTSKKEIILPSHLFSDDDNEKTIADLNTGISVMADRKSSKEHKRVAFALMILGWYCNPDQSAVLNDMEVLDNFDTYMEKVPNWLQDFFVQIFQNMDYNTSFGDYYRCHYTDKIKENVKEAFAPYNLTDEQFLRVCSLVVRTAKRMAEEELVNEG